MATQTNHLRTLLEMIDRLPPERQAEVEDFVEFLRLQGQDRGLAKAAARASAASFAKVWENSDDAVYDRL